VTEEVQEDITSTMMMISENNTTYNWQLDNKALVSPCSHCRSLFRLAFYSHCQSLHTLKLACTHTICVPAVQYMEEEN
jgi:hypothetical protein